MPVRAILEQLDRVAGFRVLREHEHGCVRVLGPDLLRRSEAFVGVRRGHPNVDKRDVRLVGPDLEQQVGGGAAAAHDLEALVLEQARDPLTQQHRVVSDDDAGRVRRSGVLQAVAAVDV